MEKFFRKFQTSLILLFLNVFVLVVSLIATLIDLYYKPGQVGLFAIMVYLVTIVIIVIGVYLYPVIHENERRVNFIESIKTAGLDDIENRADTKNQLPPEFFLKKLILSYLFSHTLLKRPS